MNNLISTTNNNFAANLHDVIEYPSRGINRTVLFEDNSSQYNLFCLAAGIEIKEHSSGRNAVISVIEGQGNLNLEGKDITLAPGKFVFMRANAPHALQAQENLAFVISFSEKIPLENSVNIASQETINIVKATAPVIKQHGKKITSRMYEIMFNKYPEVKSQFDMSAQANGKQPARLANAIYSYATHIDDMKSLQKMVDKIAHRHVQTHVLPEQYPIVGECLLQAIQDVLAGGATQEVMVAWQEAYQLLAGVFINREQQIYQSAKSS
ncbi:MAG: globin domain-containing protein [Cyanobacteria bacterium P01_F01_bin.143]